MSHILEYIWLDSESSFRSKTKVTKLVMKGVVNGTMTYNDIMMQSVPEWNYDGSSTGQATGTDSEIILKPLFVCIDPFWDIKKSPERSHSLVFCGTYDKEGKPLENNYYDFAKEIFEKHKKQEPWFGLEQEYFIINPGTNLPIGFEKTPEPQGKYYCGIGPSQTLGRKIADEHLEYCLKAGLKIGGINAEVAPGQWEFQIGPLDNVEVSNHLTMARYILCRVAEMNGLSISFHPKPLGVDADWNGSGCHVNFSTNKMRDNNGVVEINAALKKLEMYHSKHIKLFGVDNHLRLTGKHETSSMDTFTIGVGNRGSSIRIPNTTIKDKKGYFEDRRPAANIDPYLVCSLILEGTNDKDCLTNQKNEVNYII